MKLVKSILTFLLLLFSITFINAQPGNGGFGDDPNDVPVDGGIALLLMAGIGYGARKMQQAAEKTKENHKQP